MATRSLRQRSSRYSSPATFGEKEAAPKPVEEPPPRNGHQSSLDAWIEPAVRAPAPSFEDSRGLERVGVLENMQPLGTAPTQRLLQKLKLNYARPSPRATPAQAVEEDVTPATEAAEKMELASPMDGVAEQLEIYPDIPPTSQLPPDTVLISSPPRGRPPRREFGEMPFGEGVLPSPVTYPLAPPMHASPRPLSIQQQIRRDRLRSHVDRAILEAHRDNKPDLANGLARMRDDAEMNPELWNVVEAVVNKSPDPGQFKVFKRYIKYGVKQYRSQSQMTSASPYQPSPQVFNDLTSPSHRERSPRPSYPHIPAPSYPEEPRRRLNLYFNPPQATGDYGLEETPISPSTVLAPAPVPPPSRTTSRQGTTISPHKRKRSGSVSSLSSLSSTPSIVEELRHDLPPAWIDFGEVPVSSGRSRSAGQRQAANRGPAGNRLRSAASVTNHLSHPTFTQPEVATSFKANASKRLKKTRDDPDFDIDELSRRKRHYLDDSFHDYNTIPRPESDERDLVHGHPERPVMTENPPPPVVHPNRLVVPRDSLSSPLSSIAPVENNNVANGTSRRRAYDEIDPDELEVTTNESLSPVPLLVPPPPAAVVIAASRGATPRASRFQPAQKTRKSARVMVS